jgi:glutathione S-transferase
MGITVYHSPGACSMATYISLLEAGADFDIEIISLKNNEQFNSDYAALNSKKKVPFLVVDGKGLSENIAIQCDFISCTAHSKRMRTRKSVKKVLAMSSHPQ